MDFVEMQIIAGMVADMMSGQSNQQTVVTISTPIQNSVEEIVETPLSSDESAILASCAKQKADIIIDVNFLGVLRFRSHPTSLIFDDAIIQYTVILDGGGYIAFKRSDSDENAWVAISNAMI